MKECNRKQRPQMELSLILLSLIIDSDRELKWTNTTNYRSIERIQSKCEGVSFYHHRDSECIDGLISDETTKSRIFSLKFIFDLWQIIKYIKVLERHRCCHH